jgi:hypothetical protein
MEEFENRHPTEKEEKGTRIASGLRTSGHGERGSTVTPVRRRRKLARRAARRAGMRK